MVTSYVKVSRHLRRLTPRRNHPTSSVFLNFQPSTLNFQSKIPIRSGPSDPCNSFPHNFLSDPPLLNLYPTILYKNGGGGGAMVPSGRVYWPLSTIVVSPLAATLMHLLASVANKRFTAWLTPLAATLTKNRGRGVQLLLTSNSTRIPVPNVDTKAAISGPRPASGLFYCSRAEIAVADRRLVSLLDQWRASGRRWRW